MEALRNKKILITAGPTVEDIDPVRFISNRSTGRMGVALAVAAAARGMRVDLIHGPLRIPVPCQPGITAVPIRSAQDMHDVVMERIPEADVAIFCAAVADFRPAVTFSQKIKKAANETLHLELVRTPDILAEAGALVHRPFLVGFAAETEDIEANARAKMEKKNCDMLCANDVSRADSGFGSETNRIVIYRRGADPVSLPLLSKSEAAERILDEVCKAIV